MSLGSYAPQQQSLEARLKQVHSRVPDKMTAHEFDSHQDQSLKHIIRAAGLTEWDETTAVTMRTLMVQHGGLKVEKTPDGEILYRKVEWPKPLTLDEQMERHNEQIRQIVAANEARRVREAQAAANTAAVLRAPEEEARRRDFVFQLREAGLDVESLDERIEAAVERALVKHLGAEVAA